MPRTHWRRTLLKCSFASTFNIMCNCRSFSQEVLHSGTEKPPQETLVRTIVARKMLSNSANNLLDPILKELTNFTRYNGNYGLNSGYQRGRMNVFVIKTASANFLSGLCGYAGDDIIICDEKFVTLYLSSLGLAPELRTDAATGLNHVFWRWILAHEIAHADFRHDMNAFFNAAAEPEQKISMRQHSLEAAADARSVELGAFIGNTETIADVLVAVFNAEFRRTYGEVSGNASGPLRFDYARGLIYPYKLGGFHPDMTIRIATILSRRGLFSASIQASAELFLRQSGAPGILKELGIWTKPQPELR